MDKLGGRRLAAVRQGFKLTAFFFGEGNSISRCHAPHHSSRNEGYQYANYNVLHYTRLVLHNRLSSPFRSAGRLCYRFLSRVGEKCGLRSFGNSPGRRWDIPCRGAAFDRSRGPRATVCGPDPSASRSDA